VDAENNQELRYIRKNIQPMDQLINAAKEKLESLKTASSSLFQRDVVQPIKAYSIEKIQSAWEEIKTANELYKQLGYECNEVNVSLGLPPVFTLQLTRVGVPSDVEVEKLLEQCAEKPITYAIVVALCKANAMEQSLISNDWRFKGLSISMGIVPGVEMKFERINI
jgi:hypothetical protein